MKKLILIVLLGTACGGNAGFIRDGASRQSFDYQMDVQAVRHVRTVSGSADIGKVLCLMPLGEDIYKWAMEDLYADAKLAPNQVVVNLREDHAFLGIVPLFCRWTLTISGDVIEVTPGTFRAP